jgi:arylsulfatase A
MLLWKLNLVSGTMTRFLLKYSQTYFCFIFSVQLWSADPPNIIFFLADDLGYGDLQCYSADSKIPTPHLDRLASEGIRFTDAHSPSGVCSPTR